MTERLDDQQRADKPSVPTPRTDLAASLIQFATVGPQYAVVTAEFSKTLERELADVTAKLIDAQKECRRAWMQLDGVTRSAVVASVEPLSGEDRYWLEKLIADVEAPEQRNFIQGFSPMRLDFMAKMLRRALGVQSASGELIGEVIVGDGIVRDTTGPFSGLPDGTYELRRTTDRKANK